MTILEDLKSGRLVVVPREATDEMEVAGASVEDTDHGGLHGYASDVWSAMRSAAPDHTAGLIALVEGMERERGEARSLLSAADKGHPIQSAVERVLDEHSAWIARPSQDVTRAVALAAGIAWMYAPMFGANDRAAAAEARALAAEAERDALREAMAIRRFPASPPSRSPEQPE